MEIRYFCPKCECHISVVMAPEDGKQDYECPGCCHKITVEIKVNWRDRQFKKSHGGVRNGGKA